MLKNKLKSFLYNHEKFRKKSQQMNELKCKGTHHEFLLPETRVFVDRRHIYKKKKKDNMLRDNINCFF